MWERWGCMHGAALSLLLHHHRHQAPPPAGPQGAAACKDAPPVMHHAQNPARPPTRYRACLGHQVAAGIRDGPLSKGERHFLGPQQQHALPIVHLLAAAEQALLVGNPGPAQGGGEAG